MGKKKEKVKRVLHISKEYKGYLDEMPEDLKAIREARLKKK